MSEKIIMAVLSVIPAILLITCIVAAFAVQGWDVQATLLAESPQKTVKKFLPFEPRAGTTELLEDANFNISEDRSKLIFEAVLHSPLKVPVKIEEMSAEVLLDGDIVNVSLPSGVEIPAKGSAKLKLEGSLAEVEVPTQWSEEMPTPDIRNMKMKLDISGIKLEISELGGII